MTTDIHTLEQTLSLRLPNAYKEVMKDYPFHGPDYVNCQLERSLDNVLKMNLAFRQGEFGGKDWPNLYFTFGHDGAVYIYNKAIVQMNLYSQFSRW
jgi:hypothetical protein